MLESEVRSYLANLYEVTAHKSGFLPKSFVEKNPKHKKMVRFSPEKPVVYENARSINS